MDSMAHFKELFDYDLWANRESLASLASVPAEKSERALKVFGHVLGAERVWLVRFLTPPPAANPWPLVDRENALSAVESLHAEWIALLESLGQQGLEGDLSYRNTKGLEFRTPIREVLMHLVLHSAYHRGQVAAAVREAGGKPALTDYVVWVRQRNKPR